MKDRRCFVDDILRKQGASLPDPESETMLEEKFSSDWDDAEQTGQMSVDFDRRWTWPRDRKALEQKFLRDYEAYVCPEKPLSAWAAETRLNDLMDLLGQLCTYVIYRRISGLTVYRAGDEENITQEGHMSAFRQLMKDREAGTPRPGALYYYIQIYKKKTMDYLRFYGLLRSKQERDDPGPRAARKSDVTNTANLEALTTDAEGNSMDDRIRALSVDPFADMSRENAEQSRKLLMVYLGQLLDYPDKPAAPLAVMYARVLYQLERLLDADTVDALAAEYMQKQGWSADASDPSYVAHRAAATRAVQKFATSTAPGWAIARMGQRDIWDLADDSEDSLHRNFDKRLCWGNAFRDQLSMPVSPGEPMTWGQVVYTRTYPKSQIENWATDIHNSMVKKSARIICKDPGLLEYVMELTGKTNQLHKKIRERIDSQKKKEDKCR